MRILTMTTLYPNAAAPSHGVFVENRLQAFARKNNADVKVIAPVPWFPFKGDWAGRYAAFAKAPDLEVRSGIEVRHPRYAIPPKIGMTYAAKALERCFLQAALDLRICGWDFDLIDAHYLYPDGVAAVRAARRLGKPVILTARGTDVNLIPRYPRQREMILEAARNADAVITVAAALKDELVRLGAPKEKIRTLRNGVDLTVFRPLDRQEIRKKLGLTGDIILSVGHLVDRKGHDLVVEALPSLPDATLLIAGEGEKRTALEHLAKRIGVSQRVRFLGRIDHRALAEIYNAADVLALASSREGWPNVLLEAMACGTPAVASPVWGAVEVIKSPAAGRLAGERSAKAMAEAVAHILADRPARDATRAYAECYSWDETSAALLEVFNGAIDNFRREHDVAVRPVRIRRKPVRPQMILTVDTEEAFDWSQFSQTAFKVGQPGEIHRFQSLAASFGARPVYFLSYPILADTAMAAYFRSLVEDQQADLGLHLHQWVIPPKAGFEGAYYSYQCNLPKDVYRAKLEALSAAFEQAFSFRARAHRAGRYGVTAAAYEGLAAIGVDLDFSPSPAFDFTADGGPDFTELSNAPFEVICNGGRAVRVTPVTGARVVKYVKTVLPQDGGRPFSQPTRKRLSNAYSWPMRLTCEGTNLEALKRLTRKLVKDGVNPLTFSLHSTTLTPGANPYGASVGEVSARLAFCQAYFEFFQKDLAGEFISLGDLSRLYCADA